MRVILSAAGRAFLRDAAVAFLALATGILTAPNEAQALALAGAASIAAVASGLRAVRVFVPGLSAALATRLGLAGSEVVLTVITTFVAGVIAVGLEVLSAPSLDAAKTAGFAATLAIGTGIVRALQAWLTPGEAPGTGGGIVVPSQPVAPASLPTVR
jgi:methylmalonyl-CoA mutase cobalamin-binding subunit